MNVLVFQGLLIPFIGTVAGSACVLFLKQQLNATLQKALSGFAAGVMIAASVWSLLIPSINQAEQSGMGKLSFFPAVCGFCLGILFLLFLDVTIPHMHLNESVEGPRSHLSKTTMMLLAVGLHNIPEGMAVGIVYAGWLSGSTPISGSAALALAVGIAIQNFPEGAIVSMPMHGNGLSKKKSFLYGALSGAVEPLAGFITILLSGLIIPVMPYLLSFAAGAMMYVVVEELVPDMAEQEDEKHSNVGTVLFMIGFSLMMVLDVLMG